MDKSWITKDRWGPEYREGVRKFIEWASQNSPYGELINCPCKVCMNCELYNPACVYSHLIKNGFLSGYTSWICHGESSSSVNQDTPAVFQKIPVINEVSNFHDHDDMVGLIHDAFRVYDIPLFNDLGGHQNRGEAGVKDGQMNEEGHNTQPNEATTKACNFYKLVEDASTELYPGCKNFSKLSFILRLFHLKCLGRWSNKSFTMLLELLIEAFPELNLPSSTLKMKQFLKSFGLGYEKIAACPNDCMLY
ncbi:hypothetical protein SLA2020_375470 [Shorea laevis]